MGIENEIHTLLGVGVGVGETTKRESMVCFFFPPVIMITEDENTTGLEL